MRALGAHAWQRQPWKNGRGVTLEILRWPPGAEAYDVRVSLAEVTEPGAFSTFPGYERTSILVGPAPIVLRAGAGEIELVAPGDRTRVPGDADVVAHLPAGPTTLLNVLARSGAAVVGVGVVRHPIRFRFDLATWAAWVCDPPEVAATIGDVVWIA